MMIKLHEEKMETKRAIWVVFSRSKILVREQDKTVPIGLISDFPFLAAYSDSIHQLPPLNETAHKEMPVFVVDLGSQRFDEPGWERASLRQLLYSEPDAAFAIFGRAWQYVHFIRTHQFCGQCGAKTELVSWEMAVHCHQCQHRSYPRVSPCIIVSIHNRKQILLARGVRHKEANMYSTLAGFVESGEDLEQAVHREVFEEVGVKVKNLQYFGSQPWPFPHSLMIGFIAEYDSGDIKCQENEIDDAQWFDAECLPNIPPRLSIAGKLIEKTLSLIDDK